MVQSKNQENGMTDIKTLVDASVKDFPQFNVEGPTPPIKFI